ncbi:MAG: hypothetical protein JRJ05_03505 [Deltaproteobacteria bacterium]|nr:hypothetical protein [Deltaproteobacteria bacterium]MBW2691076.1 hypothetical protein [Deltaproteobacteria bacterium]
MSRLTAIALLCVAFSAPALASNEELTPVEEEAIERAATTQLADLSPEVIKALGPKGIATILAMTDTEDYDFESGSLDLVAIVVPVTLFLAILLGVVSTHMLRVRKQAQLHQTLRLMIEKGTDIPPELFTPPNAAYTDLRRGLVLVGVGLSLLILIGMFEGFADGSWAVGLIPASIGAAYLIVWRYSQRAEKS